jgi:hypothetical protein
LVQQILEQPEKWILLNAESLGEEKPQSQRTSRLQHSVALQTL